MLTPEAKTSITHFLTAYAPPSVLSAFLEALEEAQELDSTSELQEAVGVVMAAQETQG